MRVLAYIRVSSSQQEFNSSLEHQKKSIENYCIAQNLSLDPQDIFTEVDSGASPERKEFNRMRDILSKSNDVKHLIVNSIDRLTRSVYVGEVIAKEVKAKNASIVSVSQGFDDATPTGKMTRQILTVMAEQERDMIVTRTSNGRKATVKKGLFGGGKTPLGFKSVGSKTTRGHGQLTVNEEETRILEIICRMSDEMYSYREITKHLTSLNLLTRKGTPFNPGSIKKIVDARESRFKETPEESLVIPKHPIVEES